MPEPIRVLMLTSEWPTPERPLDVPFLTQQVAFLRRSGVVVDIFSFRGARNPLNYWQAWRRLRPLLDPQHYDLVHAQFGQSGLLPWPKRLPVVVTFHGCEVLGVKGPDGITTWPGKLLQKMCWMVARMSDAVIVVSNQMRQYLPSVKPIHLLPTGVDLDALQSVTSEEARRRLGLPSDERLVLFVGNPESQRKRYPLAKQAVEILNERCPARLVVAWDMTHEDTLLMMQACDVMVVASRQEGSPTIVKEALACNQPIVSVIVGDVPERLRGIEGCEICPDDQAETIAAALERTLRRGQRINGRAVMHELDEKVLAQRLIGIYRSVMKDGYNDAARNRKSMTFTTAKTGS